VRQPDLVEGGQHTIGAAASITIASPYWQISAGDGIVLVNPFRMDLLGRAMNGGRERESRLTQWLSLPSLLPIRRHQPAWE
jgi:hypothetical protein